MFQATGCSALQVCSIRISFHIASGINFMRLMLHCAFLCAAQHMYAWDRIEKTPE